MEKLVNQTPANSIINDYIILSSSSTVGACCPDQTSLGAEGLAGDLPATAPREEQNEAVMKVTRAESRGCIFIRAYTSFEHDTQA